MSRFQGYVGITNYMGARFTASEPALAPVLQRDRQARPDLRRRRRFAAQPRQPDRRRQQPALRQGRIVDRCGADVGRDRPALMRLETMARERGIAVGFATALPATIERIARMGEGGRKPRLRAGADQRGRDQGRSRANGCVAATRVAIRRHDLCLDCRGFDCTAACRMTKSPYEDLPYRPCVGMMRVQPRRAASSSAGAPTAPNTSTRRMSGRCRKAASTRAKTPSRPRCASSTRKPTSRRSRSSARSTEWLHLRHPA